MECHKCKWAANIKVWEHEGVPFEQTPCAKCSLDERSGWTMAFEERRDKSRGPGADDGDGDEGAAPVSSPKGKPPPHECFLYLSVLSSCCQCRPSCKQSVHNRVPG